MKEDNIKFGEYSMRLLKVDDVDEYYKFGFEEPDEESSYYTGTLNKYSKEQILHYLENISKDNSRYDFVICGEDEIIGEVVLSDIIESNGHYRIGIFNKRNFSKGIGYKATLKVLEFAFEELGLESVDLEVFPFNERGIGLYKKLGFEIEKCIIDEEAEEPYRDIIVMKLLKDNFSK
jgi:RimJ/RimL family protein N-acetyltransferase